MATKRNRKQNPNIQSNASIKAQERKVAEAEAKKERKEKLAKYGVGAFAVVMALSMMLPSLVALVQRPSANNGQLVTGSGVELNMDTIDKQYSAIVDSYDATLTKDPKNLEALQAAGSSCLTWASYARIFVQSNDDTAHVEELYKRSIGYFDRYLDEESSDEVYVDRALARYYSGKTDDAVAELEKYSKKHGDYAPLWSYLGVMYESQSNTDAAREAYETAIEKDPDDATGAKSIASKRLAALNGDTADTTATGSDSSSGSGSEK